MTKGKWRSTDEVVVEQVRARLLGEELPPSPQHAVTSEGNRRVHRKRWNAVCLKCRVVGRLPGGRCSCGKCGRPLIRLSSDLHPPRKNDERAWQKLRREVELRNMRNNSARTSRRPSCGSS
jgi:hypothetical protein